MNTEHDFQADIDAVGRVGQISTMLDLICRTTGMGFAAVARVTSERWVTCRSRDDLGLGLEPGDELNVLMTICNEIRATREPVIIGDVDTNAALKEHPGLLKYGFQSYISMPIIRADGSVFGTLCAIDPEPRALKNTETVEMFRLFSDLIASGLDADALLVDAERDLGEAERELDEELETGIVREQFIAVLGHDLRNPISSVASGTRMLLKTPLNEPAKQIVKLMQGSVIRMNGLIDNLMDFARGRLGDGIEIDRAPDAPLEPVLQQVVDEIRSVTDHRIETDFDFREPVDCDHMRVGQVLSNLLGNAITHGDTGVPVLVAAWQQNGLFLLSVTNGGAPIPAEAMEALFKPFSRGGGDRVSQQGLGLGLFIASQIAEAHGGKIAVSSDAETTCFTMTFPLL